jgi:hypothetical protein
MVAVPRHYGYGYTLNVGAGAPVGGTL